MSKVNVKVESSDDAKVLTVVIAADHNLTIAEIKNAFEKAFVALVEENES